MGLCLQRISPTTYTHTMQEVKARMTQMHTLRLTKQEDKGNVPNKAGYVMDSEMEAGRMGENEKQFP